MATLTQGVWWTQGSQNKMITLVLTVKKAKTIVISAGPVREAKILYKFTNLMIDSLSILVHKINLDSPVEATYLLATVDNDSSSTILTELPFTEEKEQILRPLYHTSLKGTIGDTVKQPFIVAADATNQMVSEAVEATIKQIEGFIYSL